MTNQRSMIHPSNAIVLDSKNMHVQTLKVETATNMYAGRLVKKGTNDDDIIVNTAAGNAVGWLGYEQTTKKHRPATVATIYAANAQAAVLSGPGMVILAYVEGNGAAYTKGQRLKGGGTGSLSAGTDGTDHIIAIAEESGSGLTSILVRSLI